MARELAHGAVEVGAEPTWVCTVPQNVSGVLIQNVSGKTVFVGGSGVATNDEYQGYTLNPGEAQLFPSFEFDSTDVYAVISGKSEKETARVVFVMSS